MKLEAIVLAIVMCSNIQLMWIGEWSAIPIQIQSTKMDTKVSPVDMPHVHKPVPEIFYHNKHFFFHCFLITSIAQLWILFSLTDLLIGSIQMLLDL